MSNVSKTKTSAKSEKKIPSVRRKNKYIKTFFYSFGFAFIILGLLALVLFLNSQDSRIFDFSQRYYEEARQYILAEDYAKAEEKLRQCIERDNSNADAINLLIDLYEREGRDDEAISLLQDSINANAKNAKNDTLYRRLIQLYTKQNRLQEAIDVLNSADSYVKSRIASYRPTSIIASPTAGVYDREVEVTFKLKDDAVIYYTIDGSTPNKESSVYGEDTKIVLPYGSVLVRAIAIDNNNMISDEYRAQFRIYNDNAPYEFIDEKMESIIRAILGRSSGEVYYRELSKITSIDSRVSGADSSKNIKSLADLEALSNLTSVYLNGEKEIEDFSSIANLSKLTSLTLVNCSVKGDFLNKIFSLSNLQSLTVTNSGITDLSQITSMTNLTVLNLSDNQIENITPIASLSKLQSLNLSGNKITSVSILSALSSLVDVDLSNNASLSSVDGLAGISSLTTLKISNNPVTDLSALSSCINLTNISADGTSLTSLSSLSGINALSSLDISDTVITDFSPLKNLAIKNLTDTKSGLSDISTLSGWRSLEVVDLSGNNIKDISPLGNLSKLTTVNVSNNSSASGFSSLLNCSNLTLLRAEGCSIDSGVLNELTSGKVTVVK